MTLEHKQGPSPESFYEDTVKTSGNLETAVMGITDESDALNFVRGCARLLKEDGIDASPSRIAACIISGAIAQAEASRELWQPCLDAVVTEEECWVPLNRAVELKFFNPNASLSEKTDVDAAWTIWPNIGEAEYRISRADARLVELQSAQA